MSDMQKACEEYKKHDNPAHRGVYDYLKEGAKALIEENPEVIAAISKIGEKKS